MTKKAIASLIKDEARRNYRYWLFRWPIYLLTIVVLIIVPKGLLRWFWRDRMELFWGSVYPYFYDGLRLFVPYQMMIEDATEEVQRVARPGARLFVSDLGCGTANLRLALRRRETQVAYLGFDPSPGMRRIAQRRVHRDGDQVLDLPIRSVADWRQEDVIVINNALYCVEDRVALLRRCHDLLAPGGRIIVSDPKREYAAAATLFPMHRDAMGLGVTLLTLPLVLAPALLSLRVIDAVVEEGGYFHYGELSELREDLRTVGFSMVVGPPAETYGGMNHFAVATKRH